MENGSGPGKGGASQAADWVTLGACLERRAQIPSDSRLCSLGPEGLVRSLPGFTGAAGGQAGDSMGRAQGWCCGPSRCVTSACLCNSPCPTQWSLSRGPRKRPTSRRGAVTAQELLGGKGGRRRNKGNRAGAASLPAHHVSVRGEARTRAQRGEMVRCCQRPPNPAVPRPDLHKVRVHVQRPRSGGGGRGPGAPPRLEGPGLGGLSRRARFRYWGGGAGWWPRVCAAPKLLHPHPDWVQLSQDWSLCFCSEQGGWGQWDGERGFVWFCLGPTTNQTCLKNWGAVRE